MIGLNFDPEDGDDMFLRMSVSLRRTRCYIPEDCIFKGIAVCVYFQVPHFQCKYNTADDERYLFIYLFIHSLIYIATG
jgi:hypothetical protein